MFIQWFLPDLNEVFMLSSVVFIAFGWYHIRHHHVRTHRRMMLTGATLGSLFFISYVVKSLWIGDTVFGGPSSLRPYYLAFLQFHVLLATLAAVLGVFTLRYALRSRFDRHRRIAPWTAVMWFVAAGTGLMVFLLLYVVYAPGGSASIVRAIL